MSALGASARWMLELAPAADAVAGGTAAAARLRSASDADSADMANEGSVPGGQIEQRPLDKPYQ